MVYNPKEIPENVNVTPVHPLINFAYLIATVAVISSLVYLGLGAIATQLAVRISPEMEAKIGQSFQPKISDSLRKSHFKQQQYLDDLLASLQNFPVDNYAPLSISIEKSKIANAFIFPGGHIVVTTALLTEAESENELAFILAHEIGHHIARDNLKGLGRSLVLLTVASFLGIGGGNPNVSGVTGSLTNLHYSRQQESEADVYALSAIIKRYGHGNGSLDFFNRLHSEDRDKRGEFSTYFSTHPLTIKRINYLHQLAENKGWKMEGKITELPNNLFD